MPLLTPPLKCQGIKTRAVPFIRACVPEEIAGCWVEPFCGSCVVALNIQPRRALLADTNHHIITFYQRIQHGEIDAARVRAFLEVEGAKLLRYGAAYYYEVRERFNNGGDSLDFLFLNRACFNGVMRFNKEGKFNVPWGHKPARFRQAYITRIANQVQTFAEVLGTRAWRFVVADFRDTLAQVTEQDVLYVDPPYAGRHRDFFNGWDEHAERDLVARLQHSPSHFLLSTWHSNQYRHNPAIPEQWPASRFAIKTWPHFYHVGATEHLRHAMQEALIANYPLI